MTQPAQPSPQQGSGGTTTPPPSTSTEPAQPQPQQAQPAQQAQPTQPAQQAQQQPAQTSQQPSTPRDPNEQRYTRDDILDLRNTSGYSGSKPEVLIGLLTWKEQESGQPIESFTKSDLEAWLPEFLGREV
jgi:hypothetical protein